MDKTVNRFLDIVDKLPEPPKNKDVNTNPQQIVPNFGTEGYLSCVIDKDLHDFTRDDLEDLMQLISEVNSMEKGYQLKLALVRSGSTILTFLVSLKQGQRIKEFINNGELRIQKVLAAFWEDPFKFAETVSTTRKTVSSSVKEKLRTQLSKRVIEEGTFPKFYHLSDLHTSIAAEPFRSFFNRTVKIHIQGSQQIRGLKKEKTRGMSVYELRDVLKKSNAALKEKLSAKEILTLSSLMKKANLADTFSVYLEQTQNIAEKESGKKSNPDT